MKLTLTVVRNEDADAVVQALISHGFYVTRLPSTGGFLRAGNTVLLTGLEDEQLERMTAIIESHTRLRVQPPSGGILEETQVSRAVVFVLGLEELRKL
jgi:uncharacterized protein YaaQ